MIFYRDARYLVTSEIFQSKGSTIPIADLQDLMVARQRKMPIVAITVAAVVSIALGTTALFGLRSIWVAVGVISLAAAVVVALVVRSPTEWELLARTRFDVITVLRSADDREFRMVRRALQRAVEMQRW